MLTPCSKSFHASSRTRKSSSPQTRERTLKWRCWLWEISSCCSADSSGLTCSQLASQLTQTMKQWARFSLPRHQLCLGSPRRNSETESSHYSRAKGRHPLRLSLSTSTLGELSPSQTSRKGLWTESLSRPMDNRSPLTSHPSLKSWPYLTFSIHQVKFSTSRKRSSSSLRRMFSQRASIGRIWRAETETGTTEEIPFRTSIWSDRRLWNTSRQHSLSNSQEVVGEAGQVAKGPPELLSTPRECQCPWEQVVPKHTTVWTINLS